MVKGSNKQAANKHPQSRVAFLDQAVKYLAEQQTGIRSKDGQESANDTASVSSGHDEASIRGLPQLLASQLRGVSLKSQIRLSQDVKRSICKICNTPLLQGKTSDTRTENLSRGSKKPWANVLVTSCRTCGTQKRFPTGATRQKKKEERKPTGD